MKIKHYKIEQQRECFSEIKTNTEIKFVHNLYFSYGIENRKKNSKINISFFASSSFEIFVQLRLDVID